MIYIRKGQDNNYWLWKDEYAYFASIEPDDEDFVSDYSDPLPPDLILSQADMDRIIRVGLTGPPGPVGAMGPMGLSILIKDNK